MPVRCAAYWQRTALWICKRRTLSADAVNESWERTWKGKRVVDIQYICNQQTDDFPVIFYGFPSRLYFRISLLVEIGSNLGSFSCVPSGYLHKTEGCQGLRVFSVILSSISKMTWIAISKSSLVLLPNWSGLIVLTSILQDCQHRWPGYLHTRYARLDSKNSLRSCKCFSQYAHQYTSLHSSPDSLIDRSIIDLPGSFFSIESNW